MSTELDTSGLTAEEIAALAEGDTPEELTATQGELQDKGATGATTEGDDNADDQDQKPGGDDTGAAGADDGAAAAAKADDDQPAGAAKDEPGQPASAQAHAPLLVAEAPADADAKLAEISDKKKELRQKYDDGDITFDEYEEQKEGYVKQEREIERQIDKATIAAELENQRQKNQWDADCKIFLDGHKELYEGESNLDRFRELNDTIIALARMPRNATLTGPQMLAKAHAMTLAARGEAAPAPATQKADPKPAPKQAIPKATLPPDLGSMPAASGNDPSEGKWASLDRLRDAGNGVAYEAALAKMSQADRDAYLAA